MRYLDAINLSLCLRRAIQQTAIPSPPGQLVLEISCEEFAELQRSMTREVLIEHGSVRFREVTFHNFLTIRPVADLEPHPHPFGTYKPESRRGQFYGSW